jgi:hypothetical protein
MPHAAKVTCAIPAFEVIPDVLLYSHVILTIENSWLGGEHVTTTYHWVEPH